MTIPVLHDENGNEIPCKIIPDFNNRYVAYANGQIYSTVKGCFLSFSKMPNGYLRCSLRKVPFGKFYYYLVHRLICMLFNGNPPEGKSCVNHIDCDKKNNKASNLEWCSPAENMQHASRHGRLLPQSLRLKAICAASCRPIEALDDNGNVVMSFASIKESRKCHYCCSSWSIKTGHKGHGYYWRYAAPKKPFTEPNVSFKGLVRTDGESVQEGMQGK